MRVRDVVVSPLFRLLSSCVLRARCLSATHTARSIVVFSTWSFQSRVCCAGRPHDATVSVQPVLLGTGSLSSRASPPAVRASSRLAPAPAADGSAGAGGDGTGAGADTGREAAARWAEVEAVEASGFTLAAANIAPFGQLHSRVAGATIVIGWR